MTDNFFSPSPFWSFSLETYKHEQVRRICLQLQDEFGLNVNILLACLWAAEQELQPLDQAFFQRLEQSISSWHVRQVEVVRQLRRELKESAGPVTDEQAQALYQSVLQLELKLEYVEQKIIEQNLSALSRRDGGKAETALANLTNYCKCTNSAGSTAIPALLSQLLEAWLVRPL